MPYLQLPLIKPYIQFSRIRLSDHLPPKAFAVWVQGAVVGILDKGDVRSQATYQYRCNSATPSELAALFIAAVVTPKNRAISAPEYPIFLTANWQNNFLASTTCFLLLPDRKSFSLTPFPFAFLSAKEPKSGIFFDSRKISFSFCSARRMGTFVQSVHGGFEGKKIRGGMLVTIPPELPYLKIFSDNLGNFQIMLVGGQDL